MDRYATFAAGFFVFRGQTVMTTASKRKLRPQTSLVHAGTLRSSFGETSEAMFLTQGYVYDSAEAAEARFKGEQPGFIYSRYANPTVDMFEKRMCALEGAEDARATASGMAAVTAATAVLGAGRRPRRCGARAVRLVPLGDRDADAEIRHRDDAGRRHQAGGMGKGGAAEHKAVLPGKPDQPDAGGDRHRLRGKARQFDRRAAGRRQRLCDAAAAEAARARRAYRRLFRDQAYRRPGPLPRRRHPVRQEMDRREPARLFPAHRPEPVAVQRLDAAQGAGDAAGARAPADRERRQGSPISWPSSRRSAASSIRAGPTIRRPTSSPGR